MNPHTHQPRKSDEAGVALLIAIFMLLLVSAVAVSLMLSSGTESSLASNYRSQTKAYYAAYAGIEEARGRLLPSNPNTLVPATVPSTGLALGQVVYITHPVAGEVVAPTTPGNAYYDAEYQQEWTTPVTGAAAQIVASVADTGGVQGPMFKWVRITPATEQSINLEVDSTQGLPLNNAIKLFYDPDHLNLGGSADPSLIVNAAPPNSAEPVYEIASLAVLPNGAKKLLEYVVTPVTFNLSFPSALTLAASSVTFHGANSNPYKVDGTDGSGSPVAVPGCTTNSHTSLPAIGTTDPSGSQANVNAITANIPRPGNYTGGGLSTPSVGNVTLNPSLDSAASLNSLVQEITQNANVVLTEQGGTAVSSSQLPSAMIASGSTCTPETVVVQGDFDLGPTTGCGLLVVTGNFNYQGNSGWNGVILVIGTGTTTFSGNGGGNGQFDGAIYVASTTPTNGNPLGPVGFDISGGGGNGIYYDSCWVQAVNKPVTLQVLSFREISL